MKADFDDAPEWLRAGQKKGGVAPLFAWIVGVCVVLGALLLGGQALMQGPLKNLASEQQASTQAETPKPIQIKNTGQDWARIVEEQSRRDAQMQSQEVNKPTKQTAFNDKNYKRPDAINVLTFNETRVPEEPKTKRQGVRVTVVAETKDSACWPLKEGSIERRNCKFSQGLNSRNQNY